MRSLYPFNVTLCSCTVRIEKTLFLEDIYTIRSGGEMKKRILFSFLLIPFLFFITSCQLFNDEESVFDQYTPLAFEDFKEAERLTVTEAETIIFKNAQAWEAFWYDHTDQDNFPQEPPKVDFSQYMLIAVFWGSGYSGCVEWVDAIESVVKEDTFINVHVGTLPDLGLCEMIVYPLQVVKIEQMDLPVKFTGDAPGT